MKSMTGYGRGECSQNGLKITVEVSSVNRRQSDISVNLPRNLEPLEAQIRDEINRLVSRGRLVVRVTLHASDKSRAAVVRVNEKLARGYLKEFRQLAKDLKIRDEVSLDLLLRAPGVMETDEDEADAEDFWPSVKKSLDDALAAMLKMRQREGKHLEKDLSARMTVIRKAVARIEEQAPKVSARYRDQLRERVRSAGLDMPSLEDERLLKEVIYYADRSDVTEELTRLQSHFHQFDESVISTEPVGRTLDFLSQEMNREINTIGSKANDSVISKEVVVVKAELERFREQVQNVE